MIGDHIVKDFKDCDFFYNGNEFYHNVTLKDAYKHLNPFSSKIYLDVDNFNGVIKIISSNAEEESKTYEIDVLTFKEKV